MTVKELIEQLNKMPQNERVGYVWNGSLSSSVDLVWDSKSHGVVLCYYDTAVYPTSDRPKDAPTAEEQHYWYSEERPK